MALEQDEHGFYQEELAGRERLGYPPFADLIRLMTVAKEPERAQSGARLLVERLAPHFSAQELRGPSRLAGAQRAGQVASLGGGARRREGAGDRGPGLGPTGGTVSASGSDAVGGCGSAILQLTKQ